MIAAAFLNLLVISQLIISAPVLTCSKAAQCNQAKQFSFFVAKSQHGHTIQTIFFLEVQKVAACC